jgi:hypothetical protein
VHVQLLRWPPLCILSEIKIFAFPAIERELQSREFL